MKHPVAASKALCSKCVGNSSTLDDDGISSGISVNKEEMLNPMSSSFVDQQTDDGEMATNLSNGSTANADRSETDAHVVPEASSQQRASVGTRTRIGLQRNWFGSGRTVCVCAGGALVSSTVLALRTSAPVQGREEAAACPRTR